MTTTDSTDLDQVANRRVRRLLELAVKYGYGVQPSEHVEGCWAVFRAEAAEFYYGERHLNVYATRNHSCVVYLADDPGGREYAPITQRAASLLLVERCL